MAVPTTSATAERVVGLLTTLWQKEYSAFRQQFDEIPVEEIPLVITALGQIALFFMDQVDEDVSGLLTQFAVANFWRHIEEI